MDRQQGPLFSPAEWRQIAASFDLSPRQSQIGMLLMDGRSDKQIATSIGIALPTLRTHLDRLFGKVGAADRVEFMVCVFRQHRQRPGASGGASS